ncbi:sulfoacetaldehyde acetyltransferase [Pseudothauera nasutitermitis]|uniref:Sulfoacetaldehyde acetyltransferase n=1 Tax=Pseudothauera nasutitermitis TaxID=2565930 RepID=A0A4S4B3N5_9RHOO|nr:sulfoacetaldehyde acetyltransferase [Pseudothauera nasutitermitis]THF67272.1 sulfoacetaldehyde acetyltransferase [Pseudothauera nasutitermitis]
MSAPAPVYEGRQRVSASEAFVETLVAQGVTDVFGIVGSAYMDAHDLFPLAGIRFISVAHEQNAAHMADGYARATGRHGVCIAQNGPGITNFVTAIAAAYWAHSPVVAITPEAGSATAGLGGFQETEQLPIFSKITKWQTHVNSPARIAELTGRAFHYALHERGPVQVNIPRDYFYGEIDTEIPRPFRVERGPGDAEAIRQAARLLAEAKFPVIVAGGGVAMADGVAELITLAERLSAPVVNSYLHNDSFPASHPLAAGPLGYQGSKAAMHLIAKADVVLALGTRLGPFGTLPQYGLDYWPAQAKIIQVDADLRVLGLVKKIALGIHGDARAAARAIDAELSARLGERVPNAGRLAEIAAEREAWAAELAAQAGTNEAGRVDPRRALAALAAARPANAMVATDIGNVCSVSNSYLQFDTPNSFFAAMSFGNCGYAFPTAIGAKVGRPDRPSIAYIGDGAWGMSLAEVLTCVRENIPVVAVVFDNAQWGAEKRNQIDYFDSRFLGTELQNPNFAEVARAMGANGYTVEHEDQVGDALRLAISSNRPTVINLRLTQALGDPFRRDAFKPPRRLLAKYAAYSARG